MMRLVCHVAILGKWPATSVPTTKNKIRLPSLDPKETSECIAICLKCSLFGPLERV